MVGFRGITGCVSVNLNLVEWWSLGIVLGCAMVNPRGELAVTVGLPRLRKRLLSDFKIENKMFSLRILMNNFKGGHFWLLCIEDWPILSGKCSIYSDWPWLKLTLGGFYYCNERGGQLLETYHSCGCRISLRKRIFSSIIHPEKRWVSSMTGNQDSKETLKLR